MAKSLFTTSSSVRSWSLIGEPSGCFVSSATTRIQLSTCSGEMTAMVPPSTSHTRSLIPVGTWAMTLARHHVFCDVSLSLEKYTSTSCPICKRPEELFRLRLLGREEEEEEEEEEEDEEEDDEEDDEEDGEEEDDDDDDDEEETVISLAFLLGSTKDIISATSSDLTAEALVFVLVDTRGDAYDEEGTGGWDEVGEGVVCSKIPLPSSTKATAAGT